MRPTLDSPPRIANPIYAEVVPRELTYATQEDLLVNPAWYIDEDGALNPDKLLEVFQEYFRENSEHWLKLFQYQEAGPQLLQAFLQRVLNGGGASRASTVWGGSGWTCSSGGRGRGASNGS